MHDNTQTQTKGKIDNVNIEIKKHELDKYNNNTQILFNLIFVTLGSFLCYLVISRGILAILCAIFISKLITVFLFDYLLDSIFLYRYSFKSEEKIDKNQVKFMCKQYDYVYKGCVVLKIEGNYYHSQQEGFISYTEVSDVYKKGTIIFKIEYMKKWNKK